MNRGQGTGTGTSLIPRRLGAGTGRGVRGVAARPCRALRAVREVCEEVSRLGAEASQRVFPVRRALRTAREVCKEVSLLRAEVLRLALSRFGAPFVGEEVSAKLPRIPAAVVGV